MGGMRAIAILGLESPGDLSNHPEAPVLNVSYDDTAKSDANSGAPARWLTSPPHVLGTSSLPIYAPATLGRPIRVCKFRELWWSTGLSQTVTSAANDTAATLTLQARATMGPKQRTLLRGALWTLAVAAFLTFVGATALGLV